MNRLFLLYFLAAFGLSLIASDASAERKLYRWVDDEGVVHMGDHVPPEYANRDRDLLNEQGLTVGFEEGEITEEEQAELDRQAAIAEAEQAEREKAARRDRMLLDTYLSVADIEDLRDRRLELIDSQIKVTEFYLENLHRRLDQLKQDSERFAPLNESPDAPPLPDFVALDISRTEASIELYEQRLNQSRAEQEELRDAFEADIERFKELRGRG